MSDFGDFSSGLMPPMAKLAPTTPPCALRPPPDCGVGPVPGPKVGNVNPNGGLLLVPRTKIGACAEAVPPGNKGRSNFSRRAAAEFFLHVRLGQPVVVDAKSAAHHPVAVPRGIPRDTDARTEQIVDRVQQSVVGSLGIAVRHLLLLCCTGSQVEVSKHRRRTLRPRVAAVVVAQAQGQGQILSCFPSVLHKQSEGSGSGIPTPQLFCAGRGIVIDAVFVCGSVLRQSQQIAEREFRLRPGPLEGLDVISVPAFITELQSVRALYMREDVAPVIVVLNEIALRETDADRPGRNPR